MVESGREPVIGRNPASTEKLSGRVPEKRRISVSTKKWENPGENRRKVETLRVPKKYLAVYLKRVE